MTVRCPECERRYRIDSEMLKKPALRFRCTGCGHIFQVRRPDEPSKIYVPHEDDAPSLDIPLGQEEDFKKIARLLDDIDSGRDESSSEPDEQPAPSGEPSEDPPKPSSVRQERNIPPAKRRNTRLSGLTVVLFLCLFIALAALFLWQSSPVRTAITSGFSDTLATIESWIVSHNDRDFLEEARRNIELLDVEESVHNNWIAGKILLVEGIAMNNSDYTLSSIRVKGKLMDTNRNIIAEAEAYCGNLLSGEELRNLTRREIERELMMPSGRDRRGVTIPPGGPIPFMIAFVNPESEAGRFAVELVDITLAGPENESR